jgi:L-cystine transport system substrate-binding protein
VTFPEVTNLIKKTTSSRSLALVGLAAGALVLTGCGSSSTDTRSGSAGSPQAGTSLEEIQDAGVITVGTEGTYRPFTFHEGGSGELTGYDVEVMEAVAEELGVEVQFEETQWDAIFAGLDAGRFDVIANQVSITPEREADYAFSKPYTVSPGVIVVKDGDTSISSFDDLTGKTTAQSLTSNWYELAKDSGAEIQDVEGWAEAVALLKQGRVDATVNDELTFLDYQETEGDTSLEIAATTDDEAHNAFTFRKGSDDLVAAVDKALGTLRKDGTLAEISEKYFGADVSR